jgi:hypothetical protein
MFIERHPLTLPMRGRVVIQLQNGGYFRLYRPVGGDTRVLYINLVCQHGILEKSNSRLGTAPTGGMLRYSQNDDRKEFRPRDVVLFRL